MEIKRDLYLDRLIRRENNGLIKVVTGVRRCGKSYEMGIVTMGIRRFLLNKNSLEL